MQVSVCQTGICKYVCGLELPDIHSEYGVRVAELPDRRSEYGVRVLSCRTGVASTLSGSCVVEPV